MAKLMIRHIKKIVYFGKKSKVIEKIGYRKTSVGLHYLFLSDKINVDSTMRASSIIEKEYENRIKYSG